MIKKHGVQSYQTGLLEGLFETEIEALKKCNELNGKYAHGREELKDFRTVFVVDGKVYNDEHEFYEA